MKHGISRGMVVLLAMLAAWVTPPVSWADVRQYDGTYAALLSCDPLPNTQPMRNQPFTLAITNGAVGYDREVRMPNGIDSTGVTEHGKGTVSVGGAVVVSGTAGNNQWSFRSSFQGQFAGTTLRLTGTQVWNLPQSQGGGPFKRTCTVTATPLGR